MVAYVPGDQVQRALVAASLQRQAKLLTVLDREHTSRELYGMMRAVQYEVQILMDQLAIPGLPDPPEQHRKPLARDSELPLG